jgi:hypothetical protein
MDADLEALLSSMDGDTNPAEPAAGTAGAAGDDD